MRRALTIVALLLSACGEPPEPPRFAPATRSRATWLLEPPELGLGEVGVLELAIVTPPDHTPRPYEPPESPAGFWVLETEHLPVAKELSNWIHRSVVRIRAREVGRFEWPAFDLEVETPDDEIEAVAVDALAIEVRSSLQEHAGRHTPYGPRELVIARGDERSLAVAFASGAALGFALVGLVALARRRRAAPDARPPAVSERPPPWVTACEAVDRARVTLESEPVLALDALSIALRRYAAQRFGGSSHTRTTPELEASNPPFTLTTRWPVFLELLRDLDSRRFPASDDDCALRSATAALADRVAAFVEKTTPRDAS